ncbi:hypothetical protein A3D80_01150 [Candidatus Roizmanbacteria bacterium RIFCSPHIGHO2_02_FULL_40_13b]|uniref:Nudix hydrolase domain-containing protein n=1 Tax=Candidatus Roizmanbacteria bacterium RIFCSPHIGHO2_01_FULL_39_24 TaxID=1802032 RepID=A0A1F7GI69_9BACT|nr:MAG: hypothetical protein A2799_03035 [Candidatus Roizmanbacteria bacterium RIFCSPHIGHO2_01_FULL_39_24]OGK26332.1 MAG: hypothetical protein A3D80_01150 [Candidatus Roizmanbacteria bacterium RIFCSPHIGHO2_02_FULL_40_13b]OGK50145.1 MAG: hypothetical protein A3A56_00495 [Candidatus Roizmanbacteria bacterium RIFCSPLOWO2_01_FULL_40_32]
MYVSSKISAVFGIFFDKEGKILIIENERGIDIPGGHVELGDTDEYSAMKREAWEEAGAEIKNLILLGNVNTHSGSYRGKCMAFFTGDLIKYTSKTMNETEFLVRYSQNKTLLRKFINKAYECRKSP